MSIAAPWVPGEEYSDPGPWVPELNNTPMEGTV